MHLTWEKGGKRRSKFRPNDTQDQVCAHKPTQYLQHCTSHTSKDIDHRHLDLEAPRDDRSWHLDLETKHGGQEMTEVSTSSDIASRPVCAANVILNVVNQPSFLGSRTARFISIGLNGSGRYKTRLEILFNQ